MRRNPKHRVHPNVKRTRNKATEVEKPKKAKPEKAVKSKKSLKSNQIGCKVLNFTPYF